MASGGSNNNHHKGARKTVATATSMTTAHCPKKASTANMETQPAKKAGTDENSQSPINPFKLDRISNGSGKLLKRDDLVD